MSKKSTANSVKSNGTENLKSNGDHSDDFGLFVTKIENKPDESARAQYLTNQINKATNNNNNNSKKKARF